MTKTAPNSNSSVRIWQATTAALLVTLIVSLVFMKPPARESTATAVAVPLGGEDATLAENQPPSEQDAFLPENVVLAEPGLQISYDHPYRTDTLHISLAFGEEVEYKASMMAGETIVYSWQSAQPMYVDMHGEPPDYPDSPTVRYEEADGVRSGFGRMTVPFDGKHGWYWMNVGEKDAVIELTISGFYDKMEEVYRKKQ